MLFAGGSTGLEQLIISGALTLKGLGFFRFNCDMTLLEGDICFICISKAISKTDEIRFVI